MKSSLLLLALSTLLLASSVYSDNSSPFWSAYKEQLFSFFKGGNNADGMQLLTTPMVAKYDTHPSEQSLGDILNPVSKWGSVRDVSSAKDSLPAQYYEFLSNLKVSPLDETLAAKIESQKKVLKGIQNAIDEQQPKCQERYEQYKEYGITTGTYDEFIQQWCVRLSSSLTELALSEMELKRLASSSKDQDIRDALARFERASETESFQWTETFTTSLSYFRRKIARNQMNSFHLSISQSELKNQKTETEWKSTEKPFIQNANGKSFSLSSSSSKFNLNIKAAGYVGINVAPQKWYSQKVVDAHVKGPFVDKSIAKDFFGKNKKLSMIPTKLFMVYQPEIVLEVGSEDVEYFRSTPKIEIGPFSGIVQSIKEIVKKGDDDLSVEDAPEGEEEKSTVTKSYRIVVRDPRDDPLIIAVDNKLM